MVTRLRFGVANGVECVAFTRVIQGCADEQCDEPQFVCSPLGGLAAPFYRASATNPTNVVIAGVRKTLVTNSEPQAASSNARDFLRLIPVPAISRRRHPML